MAAVISQESAFEDTRRPAHAMIWIAPSEKDQDHAALEKRLWAAANQLWAGAGLKQSEYSEPVLGLIFLRFAEVRFAAQRAKLLPSTSGRGTEGEGAARPSRRGSRVDEPAAYHAEGILYLPAAARFDHLLNLPEGTSLGTKVNDAMRGIEKENPHMAGVLPKSYQIFDSRLLAELLKTISTIPATLVGDAFGKIYEYFLGTFAMSEGQKGGEFYTPPSIVSLLVEILAPFHGRILDLACGSGGMFVQSARFVSAHRKNPARELSIHGQERVDATVRLARMNLAVHGLEGEIKQGNAYYEDLHDAVGRFDFLLDNPPFNVSAVDRERLKDFVGPGRRFPFGLPRTDNANYLWIQLFYSALNEKGRAGFVMANSASDARASEQEIRKQIIESRAVDVMIAVGPNMFYTVTLPCTLWFLDKGKAARPQSPSPQPSPKGRGGFQFQGLVEQARKLRKERTPAEDALWELLRNRQLADLKFRRQHQIGDYIVDFFCAEHGLVVELDGEPHETSKRQKHDEKRDKYLKSLGHIVLRFENKLVFEDTENLLNKIIQSLPSTSGRGAGGEGDAYDRSNTVLFVDARHVYRQVDRAHREWTPAQIGFLANLVRLYRGEAPDYTLGGDEARAKIEEVFAPVGRASSRAAGKSLNSQPSTLNYRDVPGLCKAASLQDIAAQGWSLNPGRYVGVAPGEAVSDEDFKEQLETLNEELETLNAQARDLEQTIARNVAEILEA
jgi:type I restriction enzyme M protein